MDDADLLLQIEEGEDDPWDELHIDLIGHGIPYDESLVTMFLLRLGGYYI